MSTELQASVRTAHGKGFAHKLRKEGLIPGIIYGRDEAPVSISISFKDVNNIMHTEHRLINLSVDNKKHTVIIKDVQFGPVKDFPIHIDFLVVKPKIPFKISVPVHVTNKDIAPGVRKGGKLQHIIHRVNVVATLESLPEHITVDVKNLDNLQNIKIKDIQMEGVKILDPANSAIVNISKARS
ncbi:MAG: 50S ribosomal protein L25 [Calditrichaeota bacterium]|nr:50S ribosomal protein L25 [Calditrichota bacterium]